MVQEVMCCGAISPRADFERVEGEQERRDIDRRSCLAAFIDVVYPGLHGEASPKQSPSMLLVRRHRIEPFLEDSNGVSEREVTSADFTLDP